LVFLIFSEEIRHHSDDESSDQKADPKTQSQTLEHKGLHTSQHVYTQEHQPPVQIKKKKDQYLYRGEEAQYESDEENSANRRKIIRVLISSIRE
jgi:hypothetical protein